MRKHKIHLCSRENGGSALPPRAMCGWEQKDCRELVVMNPTRVLATGGSVPRNVCRTCHQEMVFHILGRDA